MTTLLDHLDSRTAPATAGTATTPSQRLRATMAAVRVSFTWMGTQKSLNPDQKARAAEAFGAEGRYLSAGNFSNITPRYWLGAMHSGKSQTIPKLSFNV